MDDRFSKFQPGMNAPASAALPVVPSDAATLAEVSRAVYIGAGGNVRARLVGSRDPVTFLNVPTGSVLAIRAAQVYATGTTASGLIALM